MSAAIAAYTCYKFTGLPDLDDLAYSHAQFVHRRQYDVAEITDRLLG